MSKIIRLIAPDWQGGNKREYYFGAELLSWLAPKNANQKVIKLDVMEPKNEELKKENGVIAQSCVKQNVSRAANVLKEELPDKIITFGGNCLVSQAPFDYLHGKYGSDLGVIWIDSHPDVSTPKEFYHEHAMVLGNLLGAGDPELSKSVEFPFNSGQFLYVGLQKPLDLEVKLLKNLNLNYTVQDKKLLKLEEIQKWIKENNFTKIAIHLDLDVLDPELFRSLYFSEPGVTDFPSESGKMTPKALLNILKGIFEENDVVGLTIAEFLPWDAINLKNILCKLDIFK
ncbi:arginase family protein [Bacillus cereus group sp. TH260-2LC]|uniref:arginase family protein n=1 Tax=unclassified Bacillus cereus group TaxID=2750818 RepID=UPI0022E0F7E3|nr:arginase family protein [Bacillus cereus group sp. TH260-2LC]MDA1530328.1 arginase family protein [Bacillus cereus group sp. TH260-2LC]